MKAVLIAAVSAIALASFGASFAAQGASTMEECFAKHGQMMDKPAVKNMRDCWRMHAYLMQRS